MGRPALLVTFLVAVAMVTWSELKVNHRIPQPQRFVFAGVVWGVLGVVSELGGPELAAVFGLGMVLVLTYQLYNGGGLAATRPATAQEKTVNPATQAAPAQQKGP
jgi:hypothetical protein